MRLLNAQTLSLVEFYDQDSTPDYAILSHRWETEEVTFQEMAGRPSRTTKAKLGFQKIWQFAQRAKKDRIDWIWVDTCCIDKPSSAELSEAINSMYRWYANSKVCYAFLSDVSPKPPKRSDDHASWQQEFEASAWFTRGWTLQELIAPRRLVFVSRQWSTIGTKDDVDLGIEDITGIPQYVLDTQDIFDISLAKRMSWAAGRTTTRVEDAAYCLMGLFDVNMPMLYGEGERAFIRLQEAIIKDSDDMSIFAWTESHLTAPPSAYRGLFATSPACFASAGLVKWERTELNAHFHLTNRGINLSIPLVPRDDRPDEFMAFLPGVHPPLGRAAVALVLAKVDHDQYARVNVDTVCVADYPEAQLERSMTTIFVRQRPEPGRLGHVSRANLIRLSIDRGFNEGGRITCTDARPAPYWDSTRTQFAPPTTSRVLTPPTSRTFWEGREPPQTLPPAELKFKVEDQMGQWAKGPSARVQELSLVVDVSKPWEEIAQIGQGWDITARRAKSASSYELTCVKSGTQDEFCPKIRITLKKQFLRQNLELSVVVEARIPIFV